MSSVNLGRLAVASLVGFGLALVAGLQSASMVATKTSPQVAAQIFPFNDLALEGSAFATFRNNAEDRSELSSAASAARPLAIEAVRLNGLSTKAHAVLAIASEDPELRSRIILAASQLDRRDLALQGLVLEERLANDDYEGAIETLDQILRVHPTYGREFFPMLVQALANERTIPVFERLMENKTLWHRRFADFALSSDEALPGLATLRMERPLSTEVFDRTLINRLSQVGEFELAAELFDVLGGELSDSRSPGAIDWESEFPPFHWAFVDESDLRAQASRDGSELEIFARSGKGGTIAQRIISPPLGPVSFSMAYNQGGENAGGGDRPNLRLIVTCPGVEEPLVNQPIRQGTNTVQVDPRPESCSQVQIALDARAWSGEGTLSGTLGAITMN